MRQWTLLLFFFIFEVGSAVCGAAPSSTMLIIGRAIAGIGCSGLAGGCLTIISGGFTAQKRPCKASPSCASSMLLGNC
jgi:MFS family permease